MKAHNSLRSRRVSRVLFGVALAAIVARPALPANAQTAPPLEATLIRIDAALDMVVDTSNVPHVAVGETFAVYRAIVARNPVTGRTLHDRFRIGTARVRSAGEALSMLRMEGPFERPPAPGDVMIPLRAASPPPAVRVAPTPPSAVPNNPFVVNASPSAPPGLTGDERDAIAAWSATLERPPDARIAIYQTFLHDHPTSPFAARVRREMQTLAAIVDNLDAANDRDANDTDGDDTLPAPHAAVATALREGDPFVVAFQLPGASNVRGALLHVRRQDDVAFETMPLEVDRAGFVRGRADARFVVAPALDYFVEIVTRSGHALPAIGSAERPIHVTVAEIGTPPEPLEGRTRIDLSAEYADVGTSATNPEHFFRFEGQFLQRVQLGPLYGYRAGFGAYDGIGQPLCAYPDARMPCANGAAPSAPAHATAVYGFHELEFAANDFVHFLGRIEIGIANGGLAFGLGTSMRVGRERGTNIVFGGHLFSGVGQKLFFAFMFYPLASVSMTTEAEIFNQQIDGGDPMFRFVEQVGYRLRPWLRIAVRGSYQLRNMTHGGFGGGLALNFDW